MTIQYTLMGFDPNSDDLAVEYAIPAALVHAVGSLVTELPDVFDCYDVSGDTVIAIGDLLGAQIDPTEHEFLLQAYENHE